MKKKLLKVFTTLTLLLLGITYMPGMQTVAKADYKYGNYVFEYEPEEGFMQNATSSTRTTIQTKKIKPKLTNSNVNMLVVLIQFPTSKNSSDANTLTVAKSYSSTDVSYIRSCFTGSAESLHSYVSNISNGKCSVTPSFLFQTSGTTTSYVYTAANPVDYYKPKNGDGSIGYSTSEKNSRKNELIKSAFKKIKSRIPSSLNLDANEDGLIDAIDFVVCDQSNWNDILWPHSSAVNAKNSSSYKANGAYLGPYNLITTNYLRSNGYRLLSHEYLHTLGYPDMYNYDDHSLTYNIWTMMSNNTGYPSAYERMKYGGWLSDSDFKTVSSSGTYTLGVPSYHTQSQPIAIKIAIPNSDDYFTIEYRGCSTLSYEKDYNTSAIVVNRIHPSSNGNADSSTPEVVNMRLASANNKTTSYKKLSSSKETDILNLTDSNGKSIGYSVQFSRAENTFGQFNLVKNNEIAFHKLTSNRTTYYNLHNTTFTANCLNSSVNTSNYKYTFKINGSVLSSLSSNNYVDWTPTTPGKYTLEVGITNSTGKSLFLYKTFTVQDYDIRINSLTSSMGYIFSYLNPTTFAINAYSQRGGLRYTLKVGDTYLLNNSTSNTVKWSPKEIGSYPIEATIKDADEIKITNHYNITVRDYLFYIDKITSSKGISFYANNVTLLSATLGSECEAAVKSYTFSISKQLLSLSNSRPRTQLIYETTTTKNYTTFIPSTYGVYYVDVTATDVYGKSVTETLMLYISDETHTVTPPPTLKPIIDPGKQKIDEYIKSKKIIRKELIPVIDDPIIINPKAITLI